jgi:hypothetical protein
MNLMIVDKSKIFLTFEYQFQNIHNKYWKDNKEDF